MDDSKITIFQNFPSLPDATIFWKYDIKIWKESVLQYKKLGYKTKIFCTHAEKFLLDAWDLTPYYDEIDVDFLEDNPILKNINLHYFWSSRKMECMRFQLGINPMSVYSDTDVVMRTRFQFGDYDAIVWSSENEASNPNDNIYRPWEYFSVPKNYVLPDFIFNTSNAYNCGVMWFANPDWFNIFYSHYLNFVMNNPCKYLGPEDMDEGRKRVLFACNAEQRILRAVLEKYGVVVGYIEQGTQNGHAKDGSIHYYCDKVAARIDYENKMAPHVVK